MSGVVTYQIALAQTFQESLGKLPAGHQAAILDSIGKLQRGHASVHLHALNPLPWTSFCVSRDAVRVICHREGTTLLLAWAAMHDDAYQWATRRKPQQFGNVVRFVNVPLADEDTPAPAKPTGDAPPGPLHGVTDKTFRRLDLGAGLAGSLRALPDDDALLELCTRLEPAVAEALVSLGSDPEGADAIVNRYHEAKKGGTVTLADAVTAAVNSERIWLVPPDQKALEAALAAGAESWRVFLHPSQKRLVTIKTSGPYLVTGGPGTGKTVVALHRVRHLAETLGATKDRPVLLTTFSRILAHQLEEGVASVCRDAPALVGRIVTRTLVAAATTVLEVAGAPAALLLGEDLEAAWAEALVHDQAGRGRGFHEAERDQIVLAQGLKTEDEYLHASRAGRGERLDRAAKRQVWTVLQAFEAALAKRGGDDAGGLARQAMALLAAGKVAAPFAAVVCDEVQDANPWELRLLAALAAAAGGTPQPGPDRLYLVGDGHQRLYQRPTSLRALGIEVRGRSARLNLNYRTTQGICSGALEALKGLGADALETEAGEGADAQAGYRSLRAGERPQTMTFKTPEEEADFIVARIRSTQARPFLVLARTKSMLKSLQDRLRTRGVTPTMLADTDLLPAGDHVVLATLHRSKGLEAPQVVLAGMQESPARFPGGSPEEKTLWARKERLLVYVGMTRARDWCGVTRVGRG